MAEVILPLEQLVQQGKEIFRKEFNEEPSVVSSAPGRVNIIGEHVDYNDGFVLPMALPLVTVIVGKQTTGEETTIITTCEQADKPHKVTFEMPSKNALVRAIIKGKPKWANYVKGVVSKYCGGETPAFKAVIVNSVPVGAGVSSSASLEVATYMFLDAMNDPNSATLVDKALACQKAEHEYADMPCGIMDQFIAILAKKDHALLIDCRSVTYTLIPFAMTNVVILTTNSGVKHELTGSEYPTRKKQSQQAAMLLKKLSLRDATLEDIEYLKSINTDPDIIKRARHVVTEIDRTVKAAEALKENNFHKLGKLMTESHISLRDDYEVSCPEIDSIVDITLKVEGVLGSRITGGGFGGCTVTLVYSQAVDNVIKQIKTNFKGKPKFYVCKASDGAQILERKAKSCKCK